MPESKADRLARNQMLKALEELGALELSTLSPDVQAVYRKRVAESICLLLLHMPAVLQCTAVAQKSRYCLMAGELEQLAKSTDWVGELVSVLRGEAPVLNGRAEAKPIQ
jgi:hypothetical protein